MKGALWYSVSLAASEPSRLCLGRGKIPRIMPSSGYHVNLFASSMALRTSRVDARWLLTRCRERVGGRGWPDAKTHPCSLPPPHFHSEASLLLSFTWTPTFACHSQAIEDCAITERTLVFSHAVAGYANVLLTHVATASPTDQLRHHEAEANDVQA